MKFVALGFDVRESDFPLRIAWPLFLLNTINEFVEEDVGYISSFKTGTVWRIPASSAADTATITQPDGVKRVVPIKDGRAVFLGQDAGFYKVTTGPKESEETSMFAANLSGSGGEPHRAGARAQGRREEGRRGVGVLVGVRRELDLSLGAGPGDYARSSGFVPSTG